MQLRIDMRAWRKALEQLGEKNATKAAVRAVNRSLSNARTTAVKLVAKDMALKSRVVRQRINIIKATSKRPVGYLTATTARTPLIAFGARGPEPSRGRGKGVTVKLPTGIPRHPYAFIATMKTGHRGVFERYDAGGNKGARGPRGGKIFEKKGPSVARSFESQSVPIVARATDMLEKNFASEVKFLASQATA